MVDLEGDDSSDFDFDICLGDGKLTFASKSLTSKCRPTLRNPMDPWRDNNEYKVTVKVTDNGSPLMSATREVTITVTNVNEPPVITSTGTGFTAPSKPEIEFDIAG